MGSILKRTHAWDRSTGASMHSSATDARNTLPEAIYGAIRKTSN